MKRIQYHRYGGPEEMRLEDFEIPRPSAGQVIVEMRAASLNPMDLKMRRGNMRFMSGCRFPRPMGMDFSGVVEAVGPSVTRLAVGDEVFGTARLWPSGAFAEMVLTDEKLLTTKPAALSFERAASLPTVAVAAWIGLVEKANLGRGQSVFVNGCLGGVGTAAIQIARSLGAAKVVGSCLPADQAEAERLGIDVVVADSKFDVVFDTVGNLSWADNRRLLNGTGVCVDTTPNVAKLVRGAIAGRYKLIATSATQERLDKLAALTAGGDLAPAIGKTVPLSEAIPAITELEAQGRPRRGKLVIVNPSA